MSIPIGARNSVLISTLPSIVEVFCCLSEFWRQGSQDTCSHRVSKHNTEVGKPTDGGWRDGHAILQKHIVRVLIWKIHEARILAGSKHESLAMDGHPRLVKRQPSFCRAALMSGHAIRRIRLRWSVTCHLTVKFAW